MEDTTTNTIMVARFFDMEVREYEAVSTCRDTLPVRRNCRLLIENFVGFGRVHIEGDTATLWVSIQTDPFKRAAMTSAAWYVRVVRRDGAWVFDRVLLRSRH